MRALPVFAASNLLTYNPAMDIHFYDDPQRRGRPRGEVEIKQLGVFVYPDRRRIQVGFNMTPFQERPSLEVVVTNERGEWAAATTVIETLSPNFSVTMHLRDREPTDHYTVRAIVYYQTPETDREDVHEKTTSFDLTQVGDQTKSPGDGDGTASR